MVALQEIVVDENELRIFNNGFEKRNVELGQSNFTNYTREPISVLKKIHTGRKKETEHYGRVQN